MVYQPSAGWLLHHVSFIDQADGTSTRSFLPGTQCPHSLVFHWVGLATLERKIIGIQLLCQAVISFWAILRIEASLLKNNTLTSLFWGISLCSLVPVSHLNLVPLVMVFEAILFSDCHQEYIHSYNCGTCIQVTNTSLLWKLSTYFKSYQLSYSTMYQIWCHCHGKLFLQNTISWHMSVRTSRITLKLQRPHKRLVGCLKKPL